MMLKNFKFLLIAVLFIALHACKDAAQNEIPVSDFFKSDEKNTFKISPDGKYISYLSRGEHQKQKLFIRSLADGNERLGTIFDGFGGRDYSWTYDNQIIFTQYDIL